MRYVRSPNMISGRITRLTAKTRQRVRKKELEIRIGDRRLPSGSQNGDSASRLPSLRLPMSEDESPAPQSGGDAGKLSLRWPTLVIAGLANRG